MPHPPAIPATQLAGDPCQINIACMSDSIPSANDLMATISSPLMTYAHVNPMPVQPDSKNYFCPT